MNTGVYIRRAFTFREAACFEALARSSLDLESQAELGSLMHISDESDGINATLFSAFGGLF